MLPGAAAEEAVADLEQVRALAAQRAAEQAAEQRDKRLDDDPALIAAIGNQSTQDNSYIICCPAYACAYGDAILTGQANDHGATGLRLLHVARLGRRQFVVPLARLRRGFAARGLLDEIAAGRPTVHVAGPDGEHWICLMGYQGVEDPDALSLDNFIALDPANGLEVTASYRYAPYGDACEHVSDLR